MTLKPNVKVCLSVKHSQPTVVKMINLLKEIRQKMTSGSRSDLRSSSPTGQSDRSRAVSPGIAAANLNFRRVYTNWFNALKSQGRTDEQAAYLTVGGEVELFGLLERELLRGFGLQPNHYLIDVGCGSGRLTKALASYLTGHYLGIDVVPELLAYAQRNGKPGWRFEVTTELTIPEQDAQADMICFFSVFTHLLHEQSYIYLREAKRVLKPGGKVVLSFMEFGCPEHWSVFEAAIAQIGMDLPLYVFMSRDGIEAWAAHLGLTIEAIHGGTDPLVSVSLPSPVKLDDGRLLKGRMTLGQSVCVLRKPAPLHEQQADAR